VTPEQMKRIRAVIDASARRREDVQAQLHMAFARLRALLEQDPPDENDIMRQADAIGYIRTMGHKALLRMLLQLGAELTLKQREKLFEMAAREPPLRHQRHGLYEKRGRLSWLRRLAHRSYQRLAEPIHCVGLGRRTGSHGARQAATGQGLR
jgi:hypothetical protein